VRALLLALLIVSLPAAASEEFSRFITAASRLFENLEYERALEQLANAKKFAATPDEQTQVALYEGVVLTELGRNDEAKAAFETALFLSPDAQLPVKVSPKVKAQIEAVRVHVKKELAPILAKKEADERARHEADEKARREAEAKAKAAAKVETPVQPPPQKIDEPAPPKKEVVVERATPLEPTPEGHPGSELIVEQPPPPQTPKRGVPVATIVFGAGGIGSVIAAAVFGLGSQSLVTQAMNAMYQDDTSTLRMQALGQATAADILFGISGALLVATIIATAIWVAGP
jgi:tetratricopeptide (TPR) repeat protein